MLILLSISTTYRGWFQAGGVVSGTDLLDFRPSFGTVSMKRTRSANRERKPDPKSWLAVPVRDMSPILTGLPGRTADPFGLPINVKVAVIKPVCCL